MSIIVNEKIGAACQSLTGAQGAFRSEHAIAYGKDIIRNPGLTVFAVDNLFDAAQKIVKAVKG